MTTERKQPTGPYWAYLFKLTNGDAVKHYITSSVMPTARSGEVHELVDGEFGVDLCEAILKAEHNFAKLMGIEPSVQQTWPSDYVKVYIIRITNIATGACRCIVSETPTTITSEGEEAKLLFVTLATSHEAAKVNIPNQFPHWFR